MEQTPECFYQSTLKETENRLNKLKHTSASWLTAKIVIFLIGVLFVYLGFSKGWNGNGYGLLLSFIIYIIVAKLDSRNLDKIEMTERLKTTLKNELKAMKDDFSAFPNGKEYTDPSHEYAYDLDLFGEKSFFQRLNRTITKEGSDRLAWLLNNYPKDEKLVNERNKAVRELSHDGKALILFTAVPHQEEDRLRKYIDILKNREAEQTIKFWGRKQIIACIFLVLTWSILICAISGICSWYLVGIMFFIQLLTGFMLSKSSNQMIGETEGLHKSFSVYLSILRFMREKQFETPLLQKSSNELATAESSFNHLSNLIQAIYCRMNDVMFVLMNSLFMFDIFMLRSYECWKTKAIKQIPLWLDKMADTDALVSLAIYTFNHPGNTDASFLDEKSPNIMEATDMYHPFLSQGKAVGNDLILKASEMMIVTGANMAGKSTFLRTVGINYVMAMNGIPVCAKSLKIKNIALFSSMRTADNLASHISYFHAELLRLEQLVEFCKKQPHTLIILDEILKGTNSEDKLKGSILFLKKMLQLPVTGIVATHDLKLSDLEEEDPHFQNYCFEIGLGKEISYSYKIRKGVARNLNATYLLNEILEKIPSSLPN